MLIANHSTSAFGMLDLAFERIISHARPEAGLETQSTQRLKILFFTVMKNQSTSFKFYLIALINTFLTSSFALRL